jgi:flagellar protein FlgJ
MDVNTIANNALQTYMSGTQRQAEEIGQFQSVLDKAMEDKSAVNKEDVLEACRSFESYFIQTMFREMRKTSLDGGGFIGKSNAENIFTDMLDEEVSKQAAKGSGIGLAAMMYRQLTGETLKA